MTHHSVLAGEGDELNFFPSVMVRAVSKRMILIYVVKNYSDCCVASKVKALSQKEGCCPGLGKRRWWLGLLWLPWGGEGEDTGEMVMGGNDGTCWWMDVGRGRNVKQSSGFWL